MTWNHRMTKTRFTNVDGTEEDLWEVREVFYRDDGSIQGWTERPVHPSGSTWRELVEDMVRFQRAVARPALDLTGDTPKEIYNPWGKQE